MNCTQKEYHMCWNGGIYRKQPTEKVILEFANRNNLKNEVAENYFNHHCLKCNKKIKSKEVLAMNMKYNGRKTISFYCKKHLMENLNIDKLKWDENILKFKALECDLF